jgi:hypothetical protein
MDAYLDTTSQYKGPHLYLICSLHSINPLYTQNPSVHRQPLLNLVHSPRNPLTPHQPLRILPRLNRNIERLHNRPTASAIQTVHSRAQQQVLARIRLAREPLRRRHRQRDVLQRVGIGGSEVLGRDERAQRAGVSRCERKAPGDGDVGDGLYVVFRQEGEGEGLAGGEG